MDHYAFLESRVNFIRRFLADASAPFIDRQRRIEAGEPPFDERGDNESQEPLYLDEWVEAGDFVDVIGQSAVSMLATSLHLYLKAWIADATRAIGSERLAKLGIGEPHDSRYRSAFKEGWTNGYRAYSQRLGVTWQDAPHKIELLDDIVLARNTVQHTDDLTSVRARSLHRLSAQRVSYFADPLSIALVAGRDPTVARPMRLALEPEKVNAALDEVAGFCRWLAAQSPRVPG